MSDPKRWLEEEGRAELTPLERQLLGAGARMIPPSKLDARVWAALATKMPVPSVGDAGAGSAGAVLGAAGKAKLFVAFVVLAGSGAAAGLAINNPSNLPNPSPTTVQTSTRPAARATAPAVDIPPVVTPGTPALEPSAPSPPAPVARPHPGRSASEAPAFPPPAASSAPPPTSVTLGDEAPEPPRGSTLRIEAQLLREARDAIARGDVDEAERDLARVTTLGSTGLAEERDALGVRCSMARGDRARAVALGRAFLANYPRSPLGPQIEKIVAGEKKE